MTGLTSVEVLGVAAAGVLLLIGCSFIIGDYPVYRTVQHVFVGLATCLALVVAHQHVLLPELPKVAMPSGQSFRPQLIASPFVLAITLLAMLCLVRLLGRMTWMPSIPFAVVLGSGVALVLTGIVAAALPLDTLPFASSWSSDSVLTRREWQWTPLAGAVVLLAILSAVTSYNAGAPTRWGSRERGLQRGGRWLLVLSLGALIASMATSQFAVFGAEVSLTVADWLPSVFGGFA